MVYAVISDNYQLEIIETDKASANKERKDLLPLFDTVTVKQFDNEQAVYDYCERRGINA